jgi:hypothetical protein
MDNPPNTCTIADIFRESFSAYIKKFGPLPAEHYTIANAIMMCRSESLGGHIHCCDNCGYEVTMYNSCRNRHCPQCQAYASAQWVENRFAELLPVPYFHVVFTIPWQLRDFFLRNRIPCYSLFFRCVNETMQELAADPKRLGGKIGFIAILHTWTQKMEYHPHTHIIIPSGSLSFDRKKWIPCKSDFLFPFPVMKKLFRGKIMDGFVRGVKDGSIGLHGILKKYRDQKTWKRLVNTLYKIDWVIYAKQTFNHTEDVVKYLGSYTHRLAISNKRIVDISNAQVRFRYRDRRDKNKLKEEVVSQVEFIRRFLLHAVPSKFMRIRHYGFLSNSLQGKLLPVIMRLLGKDKVQKHATKSKHWYDIIEALTGKDPTICPICQKGHLRMVARFNGRTYRQVA